MPIYHVKNNHGDEKIIEAKTKKKAVDYFLSSTITAESLSAVQLSGLIRTGKQIEFAEDKQVDDNQLDIEEQINKKEA